MFGPSRKVRPMNSQGFAKRALVYSREHTVVRKASAVIPLGLGVCAWVSLNPYFVWGTSRFLLVAAMITSGLLALAVLAGARPRDWLEAVGVTLISIFVCYITALPNLDGSHTRWVFVLPTLWVLAVLDNDARRKAFTAFASIIAVSFIPGIIVGLWRAAGLPINVSYLPYYQPQMAAEHARYVTAFGALFVESNSVELPWGGVLSRLTAVYDEPGQVGTMAGLILLADRFRLYNWRNPILAVGGLLSFSLAFFIFAIIGCAARISYVIWKGRMRETKAPALAAIAFALGTALVTGTIDLPEAPRGPHEHWVSPELVDLNTNELRQTELIDNRSLPEMQNLLDRYFSADAETILFGIAADAASQFAPTSQVGLRIFTDTGVIGFLLLSVGFGLVSFSGAKQAPQLGWIVLFIVCFGMSFYQRPIIWLPYNLLVFMGGLSLVAVPNLQKEIQHVSSYH